MFKALSKDDIHSFTLIFIPIYMLIHLYFLSQFQTLWSLDYVHLSSPLLNDLFHLLKTPLSLITIFFGLFFWIKPKVTLPIFLFSYWLIQAPTMNHLNWHDQHVAFLTLVTITISFFNPLNDKAIPLRRLVLIFLAMFYFGAGLGKVHTAGWEWMDGHTAQYRFLQYYLIFDAKLGLLIAENFWLCKIVSILTVLFELAFPLCLFYRPLEKPFLWASLLFLTTIYATMKINFFMFLAPVYLLFLPWEKITPSLKAKIPSLMKRNLY